VMNVRQSLYRLKERSSLPTKIYVSIVGVRAIEGLNAGAVVVSSVDQRTTQAYVIRILTQIQNRMVC